MSEFSTALSEKLGRVNRYITRVEEAALAESHLDITLSEAHLMAYLYHYKEENKNPKASISELADGLGFKKPSITTSVKKLEAKGYVEKSSVNGDARITKVSLTETGEKVYSLLRRFQSAEISKLEGEFSEEEADILLRAIDRLILYFKYLED